MQMELLLGPMLSLGNKVVNDAVTVNMGMSRESGDDGLYGH